MFSLAGKTALVTGATRSLGAAMTIALAEAGADIISIQRSESNTTTKHAVEALGRTYTIYTADLSSRPSLQRILPQILSSHPTINILLNCAGIVDRDPVISSSLEDYDRLFQINVTSVWLLCQAVAKSWIEKGQKGKIVNVSSILGFRGSAGQAPYAMSKGTLELMTRSMANEWAGKGINVNNIAPGYCATDMNEDLIQGGSKDFTTDGNGRIPAGRWGKPEDFKGPVVFLASGASEWVHGETLIVDGGYMTN
ncbi:NAD(P)-binding protein [Sarocladium strictum]